MSSSTAIEVAAAAREVLERSNLEEINERKLRQLVQERTGVDTSLPDLKALIHTVVEEFLGEHERDAERKGDGEEEEEEPDTGKGGKGAKGVKGSKVKKRKTEESEGEEGQDDADGSDPEPPSHNKKNPKQQPAKKFPVGESGELIVCKLSAKRRLSVGKYKGTLFVSIREFYEKDGQERPGKGISLPVEQWEVVAKHLSDIQEAIRQAQ